MLCVVLVFVPWLVFLSCFLVWCCMLYVLRCVLIVKCCSLFVVLFVFCALFVVRCLLMCVCWVLFEAGCLMVDVVVCCLVCGLC